MIEESSYSVEYIFSKIQFSRNNFDSYKKMLTLIYEKSDFETFMTNFTKCLKTCLMHEEKSQNVEKTLDFAAEFAVSFFADLNEDETCSLLEGVFQFIFDNHNNTNQLVRLRICQLMNKLLDNMGHEATVLEETYTKIAEHMLERLQDSLTSVRNQAVFALHRLQSPDDQKCEITKAFVYHMTHDPCFEVRQSIIQKIAVNKVTLASILTRLNDVKDVVRKEAYTVISRFLIKQFTTKQRQLILESGIKDRSEMCRNYVTGVLIPGWLKTLNYNYYDFLECLHVENNPYLGIKVLKSIFSKQNDVTLESRVKDMWIRDKMIPYDKLNVISVVYWRALVEFLRPNDNDEKHEHIFQQVLPDLTPFCQYIREYFFSPEKKSQEVLCDISTGTTNVINSASEVGVQSVESKKTVDNSKDAHYEPREAVLVHLLEMCKVYDLADEMGRTNMKQLCLELLQSPVLKGECVAVSASLLNHVIPSVMTKVSVMVEIITELREPLQTEDEHSVYMPDLLAIEGEEKKQRIREKIGELENEMEIVLEFNDESRVAEIKTLINSLKEELKIMMAVTPHEPGRNLNCDPDTLRKCLIIVVEVMKSGKVKQMDPTLYSLMQNFIIPTFRSEMKVEEAKEIKSLALQALGIFCVLEVELAKEYFLMFCFNVGNETLCLTALKCLYDLLHVYGIATFNIKDPYEGDGAKHEPVEYESSRPNLILLLVSLLNSESPEVRKTSVIGLSRLLLAGRMKSPDLISKLIILWFNPDIECDAHVRQPLGVFFQVFASTCPCGPNLLLKAFMPTIKELFKVEVNNPLAEVDVESVAHLIVDLTRPEVNNKICKNTSIHNQLAITVCEELLTDQYEGPNCALLLKVLNHLNLNFQNPSDITILTALVTKLVKFIPKEDKVSKRLAVNFETMLKVNLDRSESVSTVCNTLPPDDSTCKSRPTVNILIAKDSSNSESESETESVEVSPNMTCSRAIDGTERTVISGSSDGELSQESHSPKVKSMKVSSEFKHPKTVPTPLKAPSKTPRKNSRTPAKKDVITPKTPRPSARSSGRTPLRKQTNADRTPHKSNSPVSVCDKVTRSGRKRRS